MGILESSEGLGGEVVVAARLHRGQPLAQAGKRERVVAHGADVMLGLPDAPTLDARARVERVDDAPPEDVARDRRRRNEEVPRDRGVGASGSPAAVSPNRSRNRGPAGRN